MFVPGQPASIETLECVFYCGCRVQKTTRCALFFGFSNWNSGKMCCKHWTYKEQKMTHFDLLFFGLLELHSGSNVLAQRVWREKHRLLGSGGPWRHAIVVVFYCWGRLIGIWSSSVPLSIASCYDLTLSKVNSKLGLLCDSETRLRYLPSTCME
jgi:hypothetical protein